MAPRRVTEKGVEKGAENIPKNFPPPATGE